MISVGVKEGGKKLSILFCINNFLPFANLSLKLLFVLQHLASADGRFSTQLQADAVCAVLRYEAILDVGLGARLYQKPELLIAVDLRVFRRDSGSAC